MTTRLHVVLGAGGVGKTTLAAGYALALARAGGRVGLLGIDPARRLQGAIGLALSDREVLVPSAGELHAALLRPEESLRRWAAETCPDPEALARLTANAFFVALADRLAASTDLLAAIRLAEWAERDPHLMDLVVDTAPGLNAVEFLRRPQSLTALLEGRLVQWLRLFARSQQRGPRGGALRGAARRALGGLTRIAGTRMLVELADLLASVEGMLEGMLERLTRVQRWLRDGPTELLLVTAVRDDAAIFAMELARALAALSLAPRAVVVNRALPDALDAELGAVAAELGAFPPEAAGVARYACAYGAMQRRVIAAVAPLSPRVVVLPSVRGLDEATRLDALAALGDGLREALAAAGPRVGPQRCSRSA
jgi:anion-transporting  ArsA/GET3 family ATPase